MTNQIFPRLIKLLLIFSILVSVPVAAQEKLRELSTDRPDKTESANTVDRGYFQIEMDLASYSYDKTVNTKNKELALAAINLKYGVLDNLDLQFLFDSYIKQSEEDLVSGLKENNYGNGDLVTRVKINLWGNDGEEDSALALMPFVKLPISSNELGNDSYEGGFIIPYGLALSESWGLGLMTELDISRDQDNLGNHLVFINSITVSHDFDERIGFYVEYYSEQSFQDQSEYVATFDFGLTYGIGNNLQLDTGVNLAASDAADDFNPFVGFAYRFK